MGKIAFLFSGQGAQYPGMGMSWYKQNDTVKKLFNSCENIHPGILNIIENGSPEDLKKTSNTQPALYLADLAAAICTIEAGINPDMVAGFSLGEIPALAFSGAYSYEEGFYLAVKRGLFMFEASENISAEMAAVLKMDEKVVEELCGHYENVYPVNYNCPGQIVVSGIHEEMLKLFDEIKSSGGRVIPLKVGGGFHSPFMNSAAIEFGKELLKHKIKNPSIKTFSNRTSDIYSSESNMVQLLSEQINHPVKWEAIIRNMIDSGVDTFIETGVGNVLSKLIAKIDPSCKSYSCTDEEQLKNIISELN